MTDVRQEPEWVDDLRWFKHEYAHGVKVAALRGKMAVRAVDLDDDGSLYPILVEPEELNDWTETCRANVPDTAEGEVLNRHRARSKQIAAVAGWNDE